MLNLTYITRDVMLQEVGFYPKLMLLLGQRLDIVM